MNDKPSTNTGSSLSFSASGSRITDSIVGVQAENLTVYLNKHGSSAENIHYTDEKQQRALCKIERHYLDHFDPNVVPFSKELSASGVPEVNPILLDTDIYKGVNPKEDEFQPSTESKDVSRVPGEQVMLDQVVSSIHENMERGLFLALYGAAGSGKTTLSKKLLWEMKKKKCFVLHLSFMHLDYGDEKLTLQELLFDKQFRNVDKSTCNAAFQWVKENQEKCVLVFDGLDQAAWTLENSKPVDQSYETKLTVQQIVANICSKKFLEKCSLIFTSRPHSLLSLPPKLRPGRTIYVHDLSNNDMKTLFYFYAGEKAKELWLQLETKSPQILDFCHNPMLLQFVVYAGLFAEAEQINTMTSIFEAVLQQLENSQHAQGLDIESLKQDLGRMAYKGMLCKSVVFAHKDLVEVGLRDINVQDVVIKLARHSWLSQRKVFKGSEFLFYFTHQILQEVFCAYYMALHMPLKDFDEIIMKVAQGGHWSMVRRFLCGILLKDGTQTSSNEEVPSKRQRLMLAVASEASKSTTSHMEYAPVQKGKCERLLEELKNAMRDLDSDDNSGFTGSYKLLDLLVDLQECCVEVRDTLAMECPGVLDFTLVPMSTTRCHALADFLPRISRTDLWLWLSECKLDFTKFQQICDAINNMKVKLEALNVSNNKFGQEEITIICGILTKIEKELEVGGCNLDSESTHVLKEELKRLQTPLEVHGLDEKDQTVVYDEVLDSDKK